MGEKGVIKFNCHWIRSEPISREALGDMKPWRDRLYRLGMIGAYENGIGFGNLSIREPGSDRFIITGSGTGRFKSLSGKHYTRVVDFDFKSNALICRGPVKASSESLTHAALYVSDATIQAVIHIHHMEMWKRLLDHMPTTSRDAEYGSPEMVDEVMSLFRDTDVREKKILIMGGHEEGLVAFGRDLEEAGTALLRVLNE
jgi:L-ribulose-5-phosphate 4-epimerase